MAQEQVQELLDHLFRRESGRITAYLTRYLGTAHMDLAESAVQAALLKAMQSWPTGGIPDNPGAWILRVARNEAIDQLRRNRDIAMDPETISEWAGAAEPPEQPFAAELEDDQLKLLFICCHPALNREARLALTLKTVCGFSVREISRAFLAKDEAVSQRILRAKNAIRELKLAFEVPPPEELEERLASVLEVLYLLFNEGYLASEGEELLRRDLCEEAIYRTTKLSQHALGRRGAVHALLALMHFHASRFGTRTGSGGEVLLLEEQDRSLWDREHLRLGAWHLSQSQEGDMLSEYHLQAGIASCHALSPSFEETPWDRIVMFYDLLLEGNPSPVIALNRAVAVAMRDGAEAGLGEIDQLFKASSLAGYSPLWSSRAELLRRAGRSKEALEVFREALLRAGTEPERALIRKRIRELEEA